jgi:hypothetical protein
MERISRRQVVQGAGAAAAITLGAPSVRAQTGGHLLRCGFANERTTARMRRDNKERLWEDARRDQSAL